jgi:hypothetical protein
MKGPQRCNKDLAEPHGKESRFLYEICPQPLLKGSKMVVGTIVVNDKKASRLQVRTQSRDGFLWIRRVLDDPDTDYDIKVVRAER